MLEPATSRGRVVAVALIVLASALLGMLVDWRAPGLRRYAADRLMRQRGALPVPPDIAIVAIDEKSIAAYGRFPWPRGVLARTIEAVSAGGPKAIAVDVVFADVADPSEDERLTNAIARAHNVVLAAQLIESATPGGPAAWLTPEPEFALAAAGVGHVNVQVESDGVARQLGAQLADDAGQALRALPLEAVRIGLGVPEQSVAFTGKSMMLGEREIPLDVSAPSAILSGGGRRIATGRLTIDYIGPAGSFAPVTYSVADVLQGSVPAGAFRARYVLIGATAASQSDRLASPFVHLNDGHADQHGALIPGVEVLANALNTILRSRFYSGTGDFASFLWAMLAAVASLTALEFAQGKWEALRQVAALFLLTGVILLASSLAFTRLLISPPLIPALVALVCAATLGLIRRSLAASAQLDAGIAALTHSSDILAAAPVPADPAIVSWLPHGIEWKAERIRDLNAKLVARAQFVDLALRSIEDGMLIAAPDGAITFANRAAGAILQIAAPALTGQNLFARLGLPDEESRRRLVAERGRIEQEIEITAGRPRRYMLRMAAVSAEDPGATVYGLVASLSDVTRQHELQQTKNDVIALVSHEMRTPLTAIQGMTELLANYDLDVARRKEISAAINTEVKRLTGMIGEYLDITRLESGATALRMEVVRPAALLQRTALLLEPVAAHRGIRLTSKIEPGLPAVYADPELLTRAAENLISNAIKYSPRDTEVTVSAAREGDAIAIRVSDQGYGISEADLARVFEKFYRVPRIQDADVKGTGLGLALVREIAELHGGAIFVSSKVQAGSTFTLRIPIADATRNLTKMEGVTR